MSEGNSLRDRLLKERNKLTFINARETDQTKADEQEARILELNAKLQESLASEIKR